MLRFDQDYLKVGVQKIESGSPMVFIEFDKPTTFICMNSEDWDKVVSNIIGLLAEIKKGSYEEKKN